MSEHRYDLVITWSDDDQLFVADVPELPGCMAHGTSPVEAAAHAAEAITLWLDVARAEGRPIPAPRGHPLLPT